MIRSIYLAKPYIMAILPSFYKEIHSPPRLGACYAQGRAVTTGRYGKEPQINADERRYDYYYNIINIFHLEHPTRTHKTHFPEVPT